MSNVDVLTYAGNLANLAGIAEEHGERYEFFKADIANADQMDALMTEHRFYAVVNFAAESHVDRSINDPLNFIHTNVVGTSILLDCARRHGVQRFIQISTDEVYGSLGATGKFTEQSPLEPSSPYSSSKAGADLLALACHKTFDQDVIVTRCSNNYGPYQFPEKLIPLMIINAMRDDQLPVYGDGMNVRDWIHVEDHCAGIVAALFEGKAGAVYNFGGDSEMPNIETVKADPEKTGQTRDPYLLRHRSPRSRPPLRHRFLLRPARTKVETAPQLQGGSRFHHRVVREPPRLVGTAPGADRPALARNGAFQTAGREDRGSATFLLSTCSKEISLAR